MALLSSVQGVCGTVGATGGRPQRHKLGAVGQLGISRSNIAIVMGTAEWVYLTSDMHTRKPA